MLKRLSIEVSCYPPLYKTPQKLPFRVCIGMWNGLVILLASLVSLAIGVPRIYPTSEVDFTSRQAKALFITTEKALVYMLHNHKMMNLDGAMGARVLQGGHHPSFSNFGSGLLIV